MRSAVAIVLFVVGVILAANVLGGLTGRYGPERRWRNALLAGGFSVAAFVGGIVLIAA